MQNQKLGFLINKSVHCPESNKQGPASQVQRPGSSVPVPACRIQRSTLASGVQEFKRTRLRETKELEQLKHLSSKIQEAASSFAITEKKEKSKSDK